MIDTRDTTLNQRPKAFNAIGVDIPTHIDFGMVVNPLMLVANSSQSIIGGELISKEGGITRHFLVDEGNDGMPLNVRGNLSHDFTTSLDSTDNLRLTFCPTPTLASAVVRVILSPSSGIRLL